MPQLEPANFLPQLVWLALTFIPLYLIMARIALPRVAQIREQRAVRIADDLEEAETLKNQADEARQAYETALADARQKAQDTLLKNRNALQEEVENRQMELAAALARDTEKAEETILAAKTEAISSIRDVTTDICRDLVDRISGIKLDDATVRKAVEAKFASLENSRRTA